MAAFPLLAACGSSPAEPSGGGGMPQTKVVVEGNDSLAVHYVNGVYFTTDRVGIIDASVDYTHDDSKIVVWIAQGQCTFEQFDADRCTYSATSFTGGKPRKVSVTGAAAGTYTLIVANAGPSDEQISYKVTLTASAGMVLAAESPDAAAPVQAWRGRLSHR